MGINLSNAIVISCNDGENANGSYRDKLKVLLTSLSINSDSIPVILELINFKEGDDAYFASLHPSITVKMVTVNGSDEEVTYYAERNKAKMLSTYIHEKTGLLWLDTDIIVRKPLRIFFSDMHDEVPKFKVWCRFNCDSPNVKFNTGVVAVNQSEKTIKFLEDWNAKTMAYYKNWYSSQIALWDVYQDMDKKIDLINLSLEYRDTGAPSGKFKERSFLWHSNTVRHNNPEHLKEFNEYLDIANKKR